MLTVPTVPVRSVACPRCLADPDRPCVTTSSYSTYPKGTPILVHHSARYAAAQQAAYRTDNQ